MRVVELGIVIAGPCAAGKLGDWRADVIKVEPVEADPRRGNVVAAYFELDNRNKRSISLDLKTEHGREILSSLIGNAECSLPTCAPQPSNGSVSTTTGSRSGTLVSCTA